MDNTNAWEIILRAAGAAAGAIAGLYGGWSHTMTVLVIFMAVDYLTGCACALTGKSGKTTGGHFLSSVAFTGILKKGVTMLVVLLAVEMDRAVGGGTPMFQTAAVGFYVATEGLSIVENCGLLGVPVPAVLRNALEVLREKGDSGEDDTREDDTHEDDTQG